jgi:hypothetical protein
MDAVDAAQQHHLAVQEVGLYTALTTLQALPA